ncbi:MAG: Gfo/Idh/MocA family oxidoreductase [Planctomycetota bacterium]
MTLPPASPREPRPGAAPLRVGLLGAGRTRQGLGPYLARATAQAGARVVAIAGRERARCDTVARELAAQLGHPVVVADDAAALARLVDALLIAAPVPGHLAGLEAALAAGIPCLCEKPLVGVADTALGIACVERFRARSLLLVENCQWPFVLSAFGALYPERRGRLVRQLAMGLGPGWPGPAMVVDSLSHVLSLLQALVPLPAGARAEQVEQDDPSPTATRNEVRFVVRGPAGATAVRLDLTHCPAQPRPAWIEVDGARMDRRLGPDYAQSFARPDGRAEPVQDPLHQLVYGFFTDFHAGNRDRTEAHADAILLRLRLYADVLQQLGLDD